MIERMPEPSQPLVFGDYVVERELGRGGMGVVYAATHVALGKRVAIKVLLAEVSRDADLVERFKNEARTASSIEHPSIVEIHTVGHEAGAVYIVMELLQGESLAARLKARGALAVADAIAIGRQCANALDAAHRVGIVHRDLKPDNVFLVPDIEVAGGERVKLLDFGIAKLVGDSSSASVARTVTGAILGTPHYMSPEQCEGAREVDARSDLYSLGCMVFQMVTGRLPFHSAGIGGLIGMHLHVAPPTLRSIRPDLPAELDALVGRLLAKAPEDRPQTAAEVSAALRDLAGRPSTPTLAPPRPVVEVDAPTMATLAPAPAPARTNRRRRALAAGSVVVAGAAIGFVIARSPEPTAPGVSVAPLVVPVVPPVDAPSAPPERPVVEPVRRASETPRPGNLELEIARQLLANGELDSAERQLGKLRVRSPDDPAIRELDAAIRAARATRALDAMLAAARARRYDAARQHLERVRATGVATVVATANQRWKQLAPEIVAAVRARVTELAAKGSCAEARTSAKLGQELGESFEAVLLACARQARAAEDREAMIVGILRRIDTTTSTESVAMECTELLGKAPERMPWTVCVNAACSVDNTTAQVYIMRSPPELRQRLMASCPPAKR